MVAEAEQLGANVMIGVDFDYESIQIGQSSSSGLLFAADARPPDLLQPVLHPG